MIPDTDVPEGDTPVRCPYCDRPFPRERLRDIHLGDVHAVDCTETEREAAAAAVDAEGDDLFVYHLKVVGALVALYAGLVIVYMVVLAT